MLEKHSQYSLCFGTLKADQCEVCVPSNVIACDESSQAFPHHLANCKQSKSEVSLGTKLCVSFAVYTSNPVFAKTLLFCFRRPGPKTVCKR